MVLGDSLFVLMLVMEGVGAYATVIGGTFYLGLRKKDLLLAIIAFGLLSLLYTLILRSYSPFALQP